MLFRSLILAVILQTAGVVWWGATISERLTQMDREASRRVADGDKLEAATQVKIAALEARQRDAEALGVRVDERLKGVQEALQRVETALRATVK